MALALDDRPRVARGRIVPRTRSVLGVAKPRAFGAHRSLGLIAVLAIAAISSWSRRFLMDDSFISFRYAANLADGHGLVFNVGERVEGYTNFLWTVWLAVPHALGWNPILFAQLSGVLSFLAVVAVMVQLARARLSPKLALLAGLLVAINPTLGAFSTAGLETSWQTLGAVTCAAIATSTKTKFLGAMRLGTWSVVAGLTVMTRMDSVLLLVGSAVVLLFPKQKSQPDARRWLWLLLPGGLLVSGWMIWRFSYYGSWLPNTFAAKAQVPGGLLVWLEYGGVYVAGWLLSYGWILLVPLIAFRRLRTALSREDGLTLVLPTILWLCYVFRVGGDFMEYRLLAPITPFVAVLAVRLLDPLREPGGSQRWLAVSLASTWILLSVFHTQIVEGTPRLRHRMESIPQLAHHISDANPRNWRAIGRALGAGLGEAPSTVKIAVTAAGAIPYESGLLTVDMLGLTDPWVARHGRPYTDRPGHRLIAPVSYLVDRGVHLLIGHPMPAAEAPETTLEDGSYPLRHFDPEGYLYHDLQSFPAGRSVVEVPLPSGAEIAILYLADHPAVEKKIRSGDWAQFPLLVREK